MAATTKTYQNVSFSQLTGWLEANSYRTHSLVPIRIQTTVLSPETKGASMTALGLPTYSAVPLQPSGILSALAWMRNPLFADASTSVRTTIVRELATTLQTESDTLSGSRFARKRRRIFDGIGSILHGTPIKDEERADIFAGLAFLCGVQLVYVRQANGLETEANVVVENGGGDGDVDFSKGTVSFSSEPTTWSASTPTWIVDWNARWIGIPDDDDSIPTLPRLSEWLYVLENEKGWSVDWPTVDSTKEVIVQELSQEPSWKPTDSKLKKDVLASRLGRIRVLRAMRSFV